MMFHDINHMALQNSKAITCESVSEVILIPLQSNLLYLLQHSFELHVTRPNGHFKRHDILHIPQEVGSIRVGLNYIHKGVIAWH